MYSGYHGRNGRLVLRCICSIRGHNCWFGSRCHPGSRNQTFQAFVHIAERAYSTAKQHCALDKCDRFAAWSSQRSVHLCIRDFSAKHCERTTIHDPDFVHGVDISTCTNLSRWRGGKFAYSVSIVNYSWPCVGSLSPTFANTRHAAWCYSQHDRFDIQQHGSSTKRNHVDFDGCHHLFLAFDVLNRILWSKLYEIRCHSEFRCVILEDCHTSYGRHDDYPRIPSSETSCGQDATNLLDQEG